jgi:hypothetical protein
MCDMVHAMIMAWCVIMYHLCHLLSESWVWHRRRWRGLRLSVAHGHASVHDNSDTLAILCALWGLCCRQPLPLTPHLTIHKGGVGTAGGALPPSLLMMPCCHFSNLLLPYYQFCIHTAAPCAALCPPRWCWRCWWVVSTWSWRLRWAAWRGCWTGACTTSRCR